MLTFQITARNSNEDKAEHQAYLLLWGELLLQFNPETSVPPRYEFLQHIYLFICFPWLDLSRRKKKIIFPDSLVTIFSLAYIFFKHTWVPVGLPLQTHS